MEKIISYTEEELLKRKKRNLDDKAFMYFLVNLMLKYVGEADKDVYWMQSHDFEDLKAIDLFIFTQQQLAEFEKIATKIIQKQLGTSKHRAETEFSWFMLDIGFISVSETNTIEKHNEWLCKKVREFEEKHGELHYEDGWENELKIKIGYKK